MKKTLFTAITIVMWAAIVALILMFWQDWQQTYGTAVVVLYALLLLFMGVVIMAILADYLLPPKTIQLREPSAAEKKARAEQQAAEALREGKPKIAMEIYESAGLVRPAIRIAEELRDKVALARLYTKAGHHERARRYHLELEDFEGAAQASTLMGDIDVARDYYRQAARAAEGNRSLGEQASLWDRAGDMATAARMYEESGEMDRAAECYGLLGDEDDARRCGEHAKAFRAYERKMGVGEKKGESEELTAEYKADLTKAAELLESMGDFFGAGQLYREAEQLVEAGIDFERFHEWERAARAYDGAGLKDRAALSRSHVPPRPVEEKGEKPTGGPPPTSAPLPGMVSSAHFQPIQHAQYVPVYVTMTGVPSDAAENLEKVAQRVRRGHFEEAAEFAKKANDWLMAAALYERGGDLLQAADLYRQIGKNNDAMFCLEKAQRPREGAMLALAVGDHPRAIAVLEKGLEGKEDPELGIMLGELLVQKGKYSEALDVLHRKIAPDGVNQWSAEHYYRFARFFESRDAKKEAFELYKELLAGGAESAEIEKRAKGLAATLDEPFEPAGVAAGEVGETVEIDFSSDVAETLAGEEGKAQKGGRKTFPFTPPRDLETRVTEGTEATMALFPRQQMSLFGRPAAAPGEEATEIGSGVSARSRSGVVEAPHVDPFGVEQRYEIQKEIGRGGMGVIYEALDTVLGRSVALKLIQKEAASPEQYQQFLLEARAIARLSHPNVVAIYDMGVMDFKHYITMELVKGGSLSRWVEDEKGLPLKEALRVFMEMGRGLQLAHENGIVHRDIKPTNVLLNEKREVKIVDFGLAKLAQKEEEGGDKTIFKASGTPGYMAPEQIRGEESQPRADIYALGITLFYMLVGKPPHAVAKKSGQFEILSFQLEGKLPSLKEHRPDLPAPIEQVFEYCTIAKAEDRYQTVDLFLPIVEQWYAAL
ncbi:MAG: protein kinase [bacterium]